MNTRRNTSLIALLSFILIVFGSPVAFSQVYTEPQKAGIAADLVPEIAEAKHWAEFNRGWDLNFKIAILVLAIGSAVGGVVVASKFRDKPVPLPLTIFTTASSGIVAAITAFAFTQINFASRAGIWHKKAEALRTLEYQVKYGDPARESFEQSLFAVRSWNDSTPPDVQAPAVKPQK